MCTEFKNKEHYSINIDDYLQEREWLRGDPKKASRIS
jgi:hypothetical protein